VTHSSGPAARLGPIDHVAIVVRSIDGSMPHYQQLFGLEPMRATIEVPGQAVRVAFLTTGPEPAARIELIEPTDDASGVARFLATRGEGLHHVCLRSHDLSPDLDALAAAEAELIDAEPRPGADGLVAFIHPSSLNGVLWELLQRSPAQDLHTNKEER
jgi:methylmalonyl-CoA/ethylmalonyl-CoA epimerase